MLMFNSISIACVYFILMNEFLTQLVFSESVDKACSFDETVNISDGIRDGDNIIHNNLTYSKQQYNVYDYTIDETGKKHSIEKHWRGCLCLVVNCIRICDKTELIPEYLNVTKLSTGDSIVYLNNFTIFYGSYCPDIPHSAENSTVEFLPVIQIVMIHVDI
jgi:hypothetical protein